MSTQSFDFSELDKLAADIADVPRKFMPRVRKAVEVTARHVKDDWREPLSQSSWVPGGARTISYDISTSTSGVEAEVGPQIGGPGALVGMLEYGTPTTPPTGYGHAALQKNADDFEKGILLATEDLL